MLCTFKEEADGKLLIRKKSDQYQEKKRPIRRVYLVEINLHLYQQSMIQRVENLISCSLNFKPGNEFSCINFLSVLSYIQIHIKKLQGLSFCAVSFFWHQNITFPYQLLLSSDVLRFHRSISNHPVRNCR